MQQEFTTHKWLAALLAMLAGMAFPAWAQSPHFVGKVTVTLEQDGDARVCFKEAGLGSNLNVNYTASATGSATYDCVNNGGQCPNASNKSSESGPVSSSGTFNSGKNGSISQCLTLSPPSVAPFCPGGQTQTLSQVNYSNIVIADTSNGVSKGATPTSIGGTPFACPNP